MHSQAAPEFVSCSSDVHEMHDVVMHVNDTVQSLALRIVAIETEIAGKPFRESDWGGNGASKPDAGVQYFSTEDAKQLLAACSLQIDEVSTSLSNMIH